MAVFSQIKQLRQVSFLFRISGLRLKIGFVFHSPRSSQRSLTDKIGFVLQNCILSKVVFVWGLELSASEFRPEAGKLALFFH